jgi:hypothetical protein
VGDHFGLANVELFPKKLKNETPFCGKMMELIGDLTSGPSPA